MNLSRPHRRAALATVLLALLGCNSAEKREPTTMPAEAGSTAHGLRDAGAATQPVALLTRAERREADELRKAVTYLASDELEGRGLETEGINKAADYIARAMKQAGLKPAPGMNGYFQPFTISTGSTVGENTRLRVGGEALERGVDYAPMNVTAAGEFDGPVVFVGYAVAAPQFKYDDFAGIDLTGKVALAMRYEPVDADGKSRFEPHGRSSHSALTEKANAAAERGAVALLIVNPPDNDAGEDELRRTRRGGPGGGERATIPVIHVTRAAANRILAQARAKDLATLYREINAGDPRPQTFALADVTVSGGVELERDELSVKNVVGFVPGRGAGRDEYVVVGAHYDHLGRGETGTMSRLNRNAIHNGADDNASGTAAMLQMAKHFAKSKPQRSILFVAFTGEERGLLGSAHFLGNSPVPVDDIVAMFNLDMVGRLKGDKLEVGGSGTAEAFDAIVAQVDKRSPLSFKPPGAQYGGRGGIGPSDHASFAAKRIPVLFFFTGVHVDYHRPTDDADKINYAGLVQVVDASVDVVEAMTKMERAAYVDKYDRSASQMGTMKVRLGIMPEYADTGDGVKVGATLPDTPAAKAGIRDGDVIVQIGDDRVANITEYMDALNKHEPGETVTVTVTRKGEPVELPVTFTGRGG